MDNANDPTLNDITATLETLLYHSHNLALQARNLEGLAQPISMPIAMSLRAAAFMLKMPTASVELDECRFREFVNAYMATAIEALNLFDQFRASRGKHLVITENDAKLILPEDL